MSEENVDMVRRIYERWGAGDFSDRSELFDPDVVFVMNPGFPDAGTYAGFEALQEYTRGFLEPWTRITIEAEEIRDAGGNAVVAAVRQSGVGSGSGAPAELRYFQLWTVRDGRILRLESHREQPPT